MKKIITFGIVFLLLVAIVYAASLNMAAHTTVDFGTMSPKETKEMSYYVKSYFEKDGVYYSVCVEHPIEGEMEKWIRLSLDDSDNIITHPDQICNTKGKAKKTTHWVGPDLVPTWIKNVHIKLKIPPNTPPGDYTTQIGNIGCFKGSFANLCNSVPTTIKVIVK